VRTTRSPASRASWPTWRSTTPRASCFPLHRHHRGAAALRAWAGIAYPLYFAGVLMLVMTEIGGVIVNGGQRWLQLGPIRIQPSEIMKIAVPLALARYYHQMFEAGRNNGFWIHIPALAFVAIPTLLVLKTARPRHRDDDFRHRLRRDLLRRLSMRLIIAVIALVALAAPLAYFFAMHDYQRQRVQTMFDPESVPRAPATSCSKASSLSVRAGRRARDTCRVRRKEGDYIPEQRTDFIFTIVAEEFGFAGSAAVLILWGMALLQGMDIASKSKSAFGKLAAAGFVSPACSMSGSISGWSSAFCPWWASLCR